MILNNKTLLITGGTGSFGSTLVSKLLSSRIKQIRIFSRDEKKQEDMRNHYNNSKLKFIIGDVRDEEAVSNSLNGVDYVFHAAALKQVPTCEFFPMEAFKTNVIGTKNIINHSIENKIKRLVVLSTDKAVYPVNTMGVTKSLAEKLVISNSLDYSKSKTIICATRYGNVIASRGSMIPLFINQIKDGKHLTITNPKMTRFMMTLEQSVKLVLHAFENGKNGQIFVQQSPSADIETIANTIKEILNYKKPNKIIGVRHGEKMFETLVSSEEMSRCKKNKNYFCISPDTRDLNYDKYFIKGKNKIYSDYNSNNTKLLNKDEIKKLLFSSENFKALI